MHEQRNFFLALPRRSRGPDSNLKFENLQTNISGRASGCLHAQMKSGSVVVEVDGGVVVRVGVDVEGVVQVEVVVGVKP